MSTYIETMTGDVQKVVEELKAQYGEFSLAMLYKDEGLADTGWNLIIAASWADKLGRAGAIKVVTYALSNGLSMENKHSISRITVLPVSDQFVREITVRYQVSSPGSGYWIQNDSAAGIMIGSAFIFYSHHT